jgi:hypothetical protein
MPQAAAGFAVEAGANPINGLDRYWVEGPTPTQLAGVATLSGT